MANFFYKLIFLSIFLLILVSSCSKYKKPPITPISIEKPSIEFAISGRIVSAENTTLPIKDATITITSKSKPLTTSSQLIQSKTDENGLFFFKSIPLEEVIIKVDPPIDSSYSPFQFETYLIPSSTSSLNITLIPNSISETPYNIKIEPQNITINAGGTHRFNTIIKDENGNKLPLTPIYILKGNCGVIYPNGDFTALKEGECEIVTLIQSSSSTIGYISASAVVKVTGTIENELKEEDYFPLGVGFSWKYKQNYEIFYDTAEGRITTSGTQLLLSKVLGKRKIDNKECFVGSFTWFGYGSKSENEEYYTGFNEEYYTKTDDGVYKIGYEKPFDGIILYSPPRKIIPIPLETGHRWQWEDLFDDDCDYTLSVAEKEIVDTKLGSYEAFRIDVKLCKKIFDPGDYLRFWVAKGIGWIKDESQIGGIEIWDEENNMITEAATWYSTSLLIDYNFPKLKNNYNYYSFSIYPLEYKLLELKKKKKMIHNNS